MKFLFLFLLLSLSLWAKPQVDISGNIEGQTRYSWNNEDAKEELFQNWDQEEFYLLYGNINTKIDFSNSRFEANVFSRQSSTDLYANNYLAAQIYTFPNKLVARDLFKLQHFNQTGNDRSEVSLNKMYYEWNYQDHRFMVGRMYINYGLGEIFNPINPFNQPTGLTNISQVAQGNDGGLFQYYLNSTHVVDFYLLGDKSLNNYEGKISRTIWIHGEIQPSSEFQLDYVLGEDQERHKFGGQVSYRFSEAMLFLQGLYQTAYLNDDPSGSLIDVMLGFDQQLSGKWHLRLEGGHQKTNRFLSSFAARERFLPTEYFIAIANQYEIHPLIKISGTIINDVKSGFTYFIARSSFSLSDRFEADIFGFTPVSSGDGADNPAQKLVTQDIGLSLRAFF